MEWPFLKRVLRPLHSVLILNLYIMESSEKELGIFISIFWNTCYVVVFLISQ